MSGFNRCISVLRLYSEQQHAWTVQAMSDALGSPVSTIYRAVRDLVRAGLLESGTEASYRLGPAFMEFDRLTRLTDPLVQRGGAVLNDVAAAAALPCVGLLARLYNGTVMCVADAVNANGVTTGVDFRSSYERGRPMPLTNGATSKVILAHLPPRRLKSLLPTAPDPAFRATLPRIRRQGYALTRGEIDQGLVGIAAPVIAPHFGLIASLSLVIRAADLTTAAEHRLIAMLIDSAVSLTDALAAKSPSENTSTWYPDTPDARRTA